MNLYVHFPFCRRKCAYCALYSVAGKSEAFRNEYVEKLSNAIRKSSCQFKTVYFGGGTPALCDLRPIFNALQNKLHNDYEWTVELSPLDVTYARMKEFYTAGVNRISMGVQSLDDETLKSMKRGHTAEDALIAFKTIREAGFSNAGIDIIAGYPSQSQNAWARTLEKLAEFSPDHCSVYSLIHEEGTLLDREVKNGILRLPDDDTALDELIMAREVLGALSLERYEISSYAKKGFECKHNLSVWRGEDYLGLGAGAHGRIGRYRTLGTFENLTPLFPFGDEAHISDSVELTEQEDALERVFFRLRTSEGLNLDMMADEFPVLSCRVEEWKKKLFRLKDEGFIVPLQNGNVFKLSDRGMEVCDAILSELY